MSDLDVEELDLRIDAGSSDEESDEAPAAAPRRGPGRPRSSGTRKRSSTSRSKRASSRPSAKAAAADKPLSGAAADAVERARLNKLHDKVASFITMGRIARPDLIQLNDAEIDEAFIPLERVYLRHAPDIDLPITPDTADLLASARAFYWHLVRIKRLPDPITLIGRVFKPRPKRPAGSAHTTTPAGTAGAAPAASWSPPPGIQSTAPTLDDELGRLYTDTMGPDEAVDGAA